MVAKIELKTGNAPITPAAPAAPDKKVITEIITGMTDKERREAIAAFARGNYEARRAFDKLTNAARNALMHNNNIAYANDLLKILYNQRESTKFYQLFVKLFPAFCGGYEESTKGKKIVRIYDPIHSPCFFDGVNKKFIIQDWKEHRALLLNRIDNWHGLKLREISITTPEDKTDKYVKQVDKIHEAFVELAKTGEKWGTSPAARQIRSLLLMAKEIWPDCEILDNKQALQKLSTDLHGKAEKMTV